MIRLLSIFRPKPKGPTLSQYVEATKAVRAAEKAHQARAHLIQAQRDILHAALRRAA